jgi:DNA-binding transcriptional regulator YdaS (Cro superfamily)
MNPYLKLAIAMLGGTNEAAQKLGVSRYSIYQWSQAIPLKRALQIEEMTNGQVLASQLKPEFFNELNRTINGPAA